MAVLFSLVVLDSDIKEHVKQIEKAVSGKEPRFVLRALRALPSTSRRLNPNVLHKAVSGFYTSNAAGKQFLLGFLEEVRPLPTISLRDVVSHDRRQTCVKYIFVLDSVTVVI